MILLAWFGLVAASCWLVGPRYWILFRMAASSDPASFSVSA
jgi:hypothetical protein